MPWHLQGRRARVRELVWRRERGEWKREPRMPLTNYNENSGCCDTERSIGKVCGLREVLVHQPCVDNSGHLICGQDIHAKYSR